VSSLRTIDSKQVELALVARRAVPETRWAAMTAHVHTQDCERRISGYRLPARSLLTPMNRGYWWRVLRRLEYRGARAIRKHFGVGIRAMRTESNVMKVGGAEVQA